MKSIILYFVTLSLLPSLVFAFPGKVVGITDGDTVKVLRSDTHIQVKIRLAGIDTPEEKQAFGQKEGLGLWIDRHPVPPWEWMYARRHR